jgi:endo-1,3(4)-beta-glucanase
MSEISFTYQAEGAGTLMMLALPHHISTMIYPQLNNRTNKAYNPIYCIKGKMETVLGEHWEMRLSMRTVGWNYELADMLTIPELEEIARNLMIDVTTSLPNAVDPYTFGKQLGRMAQLALIADNLGIAEVRQQAVAILEQSLTPWVTGGNADTLVYDKTYGGIVTMNGLADAMADFGSGWYSDHHFHYGYFIFAAGVVARFDAPNFEANKGNYDAIARDICSTEADSDFPYARHKDFYDGHSWASGLYSQANGKGQESSSEAANAYYACYLYGLATANVPLQQHSHTLLSLEILSAQTYWHISDHSMYDPLFATGRMAGNVGGLDVTASTWFGSELEYVHGINIMPLTPLTASLFDVGYVKKQWPILASRLPSTSPSKQPVPVSCAKNPQCAELSMEGDCCPSPDGLMLACCEGQNVEDPSELRQEWKALLYAIHAVVDREAAWTEIQNINEFGVGGSKSNTLFWAASCAAPLTDYDGKPTPPDLESSIKSSCKLNSACDAIGMTGDCCPGDHGVSLGCCPRVVYTTQ